MKFTKRILIMTALAVTAVVSTGFAYDYVCNNSQYNCNTNTQYNCNNNANYAPCNNNNQNYCGPNSILEDVADTEDNILKHDRSLIVRFSCYRLLSSISIHNSIEH